MNTKLIVVRHGETEWNLIKKSQGMLNSKLTPNGIKQAKAVANALKQYQIDSFYSSDLGRAVQTSEIISKAIGVDFQTDSRFREQNMGIFQGLTSSEITKKYPEEIQQFKSNDPEFRIPDGESTRELQKRWVTAAEDLATRHKGKSILLVAHGRGLMTFMYKTMKTPLNQERTFLINNASINGFTLDEDMNWRLDFWGLTSHLNGICTLGET